jgi:hypothetical protein
MATTNKDRITKGLEFLRAGLTPFVERELKDRLGPGWQDDLAKRGELRRAKDGKIHFDAQALLKTMLGTWQEVFRATLGQAERAYVHELIDFRNKWAHDEPLSYDDTERALDTVRRLLEAVSARTEAEEVSKIRIDLTRNVIAEQVRNKTRYQLPLEGMPKAGLKPWREVIVPHRDVQSGRYAESEFAANLADVHSGSPDTAPEYKDPIEFFRRTYVTAGLRELLRGALLRLTGKGTDPIVELQTNFGGGKTHCMLALYHLFGDAQTDRLAGIEEILKETGVSAAPKVRRAVLVGTALSPGQAHKKPDGTEVRTLWGELAWQLGGKEGYAEVAESDRHGTSPGTEHLAQLFRRHAPCLILIDEWVAYARQVVGKTDLPAGTFDAQTSFAQALTEAAASVDKVLVVASIPQSHIEIGGENGLRALETLKNIFHRLGKAWRPANAQEGFEIVRRRLFEPIDPDNTVHGEATVTAFARMYKEAPNDFPQGCAEEAYKRELEGAYPIHPELFQRLYGDWSTLDKFQRTRGVLRLLAKVIHHLWVSGDRNLLILPSSVPMYDGAVKSELTQYLPDVWEPIISQDVDGEGSLPLELDNNTASFGKVSSARRVARSLYVGTAPGSDQKNPGIDDRAVRLGCVQPGEGTAVFGDALRRLCDRAKYIHQDGNRYWISTRANLNRHAEDRASSYLRDKPDDVLAEIIDRLGVAARARGDFAAVHSSIESPGDVPDEPTGRLVILSPRFPHKKAGSSSMAKTLAEDILLNRGSGPRFQTNCLVFLAADEKDLEPLKQAVAQYLAWNSILKDNATLNLDHFQEQQATKRKNETDETIKVRLRQTWCHLLVPVQASPNAKADEARRWDEFRIQGNDDLAKRASAKLITEGAFYTHDRSDGAGRMGPEVIRKALDDHLWKDRDHVSAKELIEWCARYLYLPRVKVAETILRAIEAGAIRTDFDATFAIASGYDDAGKCYVDLRTGQGGSTISPSTLLVKPAVARTQIANTPPPVLTGGDGSGGSTGRGVAPGSATPQPSGSSANETPRVFHGRVALDPLRVGRDAGKVAEEVIQHLSTLPGAKVEVTMEIHVRVPGGVDTKTVRDVTENARALKFKDHGFTKE